MGYEGLTHGIEGTMMWLTDLYFWNNGAQWNRWIWHSRLWIHRLVSRIMSFKSFKTRFWLRADKLELIVYHWFLLEHGMYSTNVAMSANWFYFVPFTIRFYTYCKTWLCKKRFNISNIFSTAAHRSHEAPLHWSENSTIGSRGSCSPWVLLRCNYFKSFTTEIKLLL